MSKFSQDTFIEYANGQLRAMKSDTPVQKSARSAALKKAVAVVKSAGAADEFEIDEFKAVAEAPAAPAAPDASPSSLEKSEDALFPEDFNDPDYLNGVSKKPVWD